MKVIFGDRVLLYKILHAGFERLGIRPRIAEVGVLRGENAMKLREIFSPSHLYLIDSWSTDGVSEYMQTNSHRSWVDDPEKHARYFGGPLKDQSTFDNLYAGVISKFGDFQDVSIIRESSRKAAGTLAALQGESSMDMIYLDASHQFEAVFDDLMLYQEVLSRNGVFQLNDCCHSDDGIRQNLGVLEAATRFCKMTGFVPAILSNTDWTDVLLVRRGSEVLAAIEEVVLSNPLAWVEVPHHLFGALRVRYGAAKNVSFL